MKSTRPTRKVVWGLLVLAVLALGVLAIVEIKSWINETPVIILAILVVAWLGVNKTHLLRKDSVTFVHAISLFIGLTIGPFPAVFSVIIGLGLSAVFYLAFRRCRNLRHCAEEYMLIASRQLISLGGGLAIYLLLGGELVSGEPSLPAVFPTIALAITFSLLFISLHAVGRWLYQTPPITRRDSILVSMIALLPIPIVIIAVVAFSVVEETALILYAALLALAVPAIKSLIELQHGLARKGRALSALFNLATSKQVPIDGKSHDALIDLALRELDLGDKAALLLVDPSDQQLKLVHTLNIPDQECHAIESALMNEELSTLLNQRDPKIFEKSDATQSTGIIHLLDEMQAAQLTSTKLHSAGKMIGQLWLFFSEGSELSYEQQDQLQLFGDQLGRTLDLSRDFAATNAELKRRVEQLARLESIGRQITSSIAVEDVYETIVFHAIQGTTATEGYLEILNTDTDSLEAVPFDPGEHNESSTTPDGIHHLAQRAFETGQVTNVQDTQVDPDLKSEKVEPRSLLFTPIISSGETIGVITLLKPETGGFTDDEQAFIIQLASQAANALRNALMYEELQERLKEQSLLYQASAQIAESLDTQTVSLALADSLAFTVNSDAAYVFRYFQQQEELEFVIGVEGRSTIEAHDKLMPLSLDIPGVKSCIQERRPIQWTSSDPPSEADGAHLSSMGAKTLLLLPLSVGERTLGLVELVRRSDSIFESEELRTAQSIAIQASIILENSDLFQQISQSNNRLYAVLNSTREGMLMIDKNGEIAVANTQLNELLNIDQDLLAEIRMTDLDDAFLQALGYKRREVQDLISSIRSGKGHLPGISTYELAGSEHQVLRRLETPVHDSSGRLIGWLIVIRDVSEEMQLEESRKHLTEMIVHDLRSPLSAILNSMELLRMQLSDHDQSPIMQQALAISDRSVHQMLGLVNALLDLSKLESGQFVLASNQVDFNELIPHLIDTFLPEAEQAGVILDYEVEQDLDTVVVDEEKIFRVLSNLLDNALKFTPAGGEVRLELRRQDDHLFADVRDTGPGVPIEFRDRIFDLYAQVPGTEGRRRGTGLGLAFCRLAVEAHGGEIWVEPNPGGGSRFRIRLPINMD